MSGAGLLFTIKQEFLPRTSRITLRPLMKLKNLVKEAAETSRPFRVTKGEDFRLKDYDPADTDGLKDKDKAIKTLHRGVELLSHLQEKLYAQDRWALLLIFQAMDAAGKDGAIKHVMSGINPQGCSVTAFKAPSQEELIGEPREDHFFRLHQEQLRSYFPGLNERSRYNRSIRD